MWIPRGWGWGCGTVLNPGRLISGSANKLWVGNVACWSQLLPLQLICWDSAYVKVASFGSILMDHSQCRRCTKYCMVSGCKLENSDRFQWIYCRFSNISLLFYMYVDLLISHPSKGVCNGSNCRSEGQCMSTSRAHVTAAPSIGLHNLEVWVPVSHPLLH